MGSMSKLYAHAVWAVWRVYKAALSPFLGRQCRFEPSCSRYAAEVLISHGPAQGSWLAFKRLCRCRPGAAWGYDPPPPAPEPRRRQWKCEG
jgi:putative membrane protein insertion efficiency factor